MAYPEHVSAVERPIITKIIRKALSRGWNISVWDEEECLLSKSRRFNDITAQVGHTGMTAFVVSDNAGRLGSIIFIHGNEEDVVHDHTDNAFMAELVREG